MKKILLLLALYFNAVCTINAQHYNQTPDSISLEEIQKLAEKDQINVSPNFKEFILENISFKVKALCFCYLGKREYRKLVNFILPKDMTGQELLDVYRPKVFDLDLLYTHSGDYLETTFVYKNTINIFFVKKNSAIYIATVSFKNGAWHADAFETDEPFSWLAGARINI